MWKDLPLVSVNFKGALPREIAIAHIETHTSKVDFSNE